MTHSCKTCRYWHALGAHLMGECRESPPDIPVISSVLHLRTFRVTEAGIGCGKWKRGGNEIIEEAEV